VNESSILNRLRDTMGEMGIDALVTASPENFCYINGIVVPSQPLMRWRHALTVLRSNGERTVIVVDMEHSTVTKSLSGIEVLAWGEFTNRPMEVLAGALADLGLGRASIALEMDYLPAEDYLELTRLLPDVNWSSCEQMLARQRQIKTPDEVALLRRLSRISDQSIRDAYRSVTIGDSEMDIAAALTRGVFTLGAENFKLMIVATGDRSQLPNVGPSERRLEATDICRVEIFSMLNGYHAGVCRTAMVKKAPPEAERIWAHLHEAKLLVLDMAKPGISTRAVYEAFIAHLNKLGLPAIKFIGHGIGLHLHEEPYLGMYSDQPLEAGMVLGVEPLVYETGYGFGMQNKDMILITENGCELLSDISDTEYLTRVD